MLPGTGVLTHSPESAEDETWQPDHAWHADSCCQKAAALDAAVGLREGWAVPDWRVRVCKLV